MTRSIVIRTLLAACLALSIAACEQPKPGATAWSGTTSEFVKPSCWADQGALDLTSCKLPKLPVIEVSEGKTLGISVDPKLGDHGWVAFLNGSALTNGSVKDSYWRVPFPGNLKQSAILQVLALNKNGDPQGVYAWELTPGK